MGKLFDLVEAYRARYAPHPPSYSRVAEEMNVSRQTLLNWQHPTKLLNKTHLQSISEVTGVPYQRVLDALLEDIGYLREEQEPKVAARRTRSGGSTQGQRQRRQLDDAGEENQDSNDETQEG